MLAFKLFGMGLSASYIFVLAIFAQSTYQKFPQPSQPEPIDFWVIFLSVVQPNNPPPHITSVTWWVLMHAWTQNETEKLNL